MTASAPSDGWAMHRAAALAARGLGRTRPNPVVGCVIERDGAVLGQGWHAVAGGPHAEVVALAAAGPGARGATVHVTLEPCHHTGRTPPCTEALLRAGVARVVYAVADPVHGGGAEALRRSGVEVVPAAAGAEAAAAVNEAWLTAAPRRRPFVALKVAVSLDGRTAAASGASHWISGPASRRMVARLRDRHDAVLVGAGTLITDDPRLTARGRARGRGAGTPGGLRDPIRVVLDARGRCPADARVLGPGGPTWIASPPAAPPPPAPAERLTVPVAADGTGRIDLPALLRALWDRGVVSVLCEGGATLAGALLAADLVDRAYVFVAPIVLGDAALPLAVLPPTAHPGSPAEARRLADVRTRRLGDDTLITGRLPGAGPAATAS